MDDFAMACLREVSALDSRLEHTRYWYGQRMTRLEKWAREELSDDLRTRFFSIVANGMPDVMEPPTSEQNYNGMKHRAEKAESELVKLRAANGMPSLLPVIRWLEGGCDPRWAAKELREYAARLGQLSPNAGVQTVSQDQLDARIKQLMEQVGYPNSMALFQAFRQLAQEVARGVPSGGEAKQDDGVKPDRVPCPAHRDLGPMPTCKACREQAQPDMSACRFNGRSTRSCALGTLGCVIDHGAPNAGVRCDSEASSTTRNDTEN